MRTVPALERGILILNEVARSSEPLSVSDIATSLGIPRSVTYELVHTLVTQDMLEQRSDGRVGLGVGVFALGSSYVSGVDLVRESQSVAREVMHEAHETVQVGRLDGSDVLYLAKVDSQQEIRLVSAVGRRVPAHCTGLGKMMLALLDKEEREKRLTDPLVSLTERSITDPAALCEQLEAIAGQGFALEIGESNPEVGCVAAPVFDHSGCNVAAMSISVPLVRFDESRQAALRELVINGARRLSVRLGFAEPHDVGSPVKVA
jgi:DNA-binding IclR family transcriptional regulator